jgi:hypothetical protein
MVISFLNELILLHPVPFYYLVPNPNLFSVETAKFFYIDPYWINAAVDGALSLAVHTARDEYFRTAIKNLPQIQKPPLYGFLLRSIVVSSWPDLLVVPGDIMTGITNSTLIETRKIPPNIILASFNEVPTEQAYVSLSQPPQQIRFGLQGEATFQTGQLQCRAISSAIPGSPVGSPISTSTILGQQLMDNGSVSQEFIINTGSLMTWLQSNIPSSTMLTPGQFGIQLIPSAPYLVFTPTAN